MHAQSYAGRHHVVQGQKSTRQVGREKSGAETIFGLILALAAIYGIGSVLAFLTTYLVQ